MGGLTGERGYSILEANQGACRALRNKEGKTMRTLGTIRTIKAGRFTVTVRAVEELDLDLSFDDDGSVARALGAGELEAFTVKASC